MSQAQAPSSLKRKCPDLGSAPDFLTDQERNLYDLIRSKKDMGIWTRDMKRETNLPDNVVNKSLKSLQAKKLIKEVVNFQNKEKKHYMATDFEPSKEITGGDWYNEGSLDTDFINLVKDQCLKHIFRQKVDTLDEILGWIRKSKIFSVEFTTRQIDEILRALVLDNGITEVKSSGFGEFAAVPVGRVCYKYTNKRSSKVKSETWAMASIPCGACPRISYCTLDGVISPTTCVYYQKWLDF